jgi:hypothetical protein
MSNLRVRLEGARLIGLAAMNEGDAHEDPDPEFEGRYRNRTECLKGEDGKAELRAIFQVFCSARVRPARSEPPGGCKTDCSHGASMAHGRSSLMVAPHEPTSEACEPTCSPIRVRPGAS